MSEGEGLSRELVNIDISLATIEEETAAYTTTESSASDETGLSSTLSQLTSDTTEVQTSSSTQNTNEPLTETAGETSATENDLSILSLTQLNFGAAAAAAISSTIKGEELLTTTARLSFLGDLDGLSYRGKEFVVSIHPEFHNIGAIRSTPKKPEPILEAYSNEISEDITVPIDSIPNISWLEDEVELLKSLHHPLNVQLDSGLAEMQEAMQQPVWLENQGSNPVPVTPLTYPIRPTRTSNSEETNGDVQIMHLEGFSPVDVHATLEELETRLALDDAMNSIHNEDADEMVEEESDSSVEIIIDNLSPEKGVSTSIDYRWKPREEKLRTDAHEATKHYRKSKLSSGSSIAGATYKLDNTSHFTLGDTTANQNLGHTVDSLPTTPSTRESVSAGENRKEKSAIVKIATLLTRKANNSTPKSKSGKEPRSHKRSPSDAFSNLDPFKKGKKVVTEEESDFSIDVDLEDSGARDRTLSSPGPFSPKSLSGTAPNVTAADPSGSKENDNLKGKTIKVAELLSSPASSPSAQNKVISYASVAATPLPVRRPQ